MNDKQFNAEIEKGSIQGSCRYREYAYIYNWVKDYPPKAKILDLGAGKSYLPVMLVENNYDVYATEANKECAMWLLDHKVKCMETGGTDLAFPTHSFDVVYTASAIEHFKTKEDGDIKTIEEVKRVLRPGGLFIVTIPIAPKYIHARYGDTNNHPLEKVYDEVEYKKRFLNGFYEIDRQLWAWSDIPSKVHSFRPAWQAEGKVSTVKTHQWEKSHGLMSVLVKEEK